MQLDLNDATLHFDDGGSGPPLLLLHGFTGDRANWEVVFDLPALRRTFRVIALDQRGHGASASATWPVTYARCARDALAVLDHLGIAQCAAIGQSLGAKSLLHAATLAPERFSSLILCGASPRVPDATRAAMRTAADTVPGPFGVQIRAFAEDRTDLAFTEEHLAAIRARTLIVHGDRDDLYPVELAVELYRAIPAASLWVVPEAGHDAIFTAARDVFATRALAFLRARAPVSSGNVAGPSGPGT